MGFASLTYVSLEEQAVLYFIEKYVKFKQGEVWRQIKAEFEAEVRAAALRPTVDITVAGAGIVVGTVGLAARGVTTGPGTRLGH